MKIPSKAIPKFAGLKEKLSSDADNADLRKAILNALPQAVAQTKELAPYFQATNERETAKKIFDFLKARVKYKADDYRQVIQLPSAILRPGAIADCKSLSLFTAAILQNLGIPWHFVLASYTDSTIPGHIYVQTDSGIIIDVVWGKFDSEKKPRYKYKMRTGTNKIGLGADEPIGILDKFRANIKEKAQDVKQFVQEKGEQFKSYVKEKAEDIGGAAKTAAFAPGRNLLLIIIKNNLDGLATKFQKLDQGKLRTAWNNVGGNWTALQDAIRKGASKKSRNIGLLKGLVKIAGINGIGQTKTAEFFKRPDVQNSIITLTTTIGTAVGAAVGSATGPGAAVTSTTGAGSGAVMGKVLNAMAELLPQLLAMILPQDQGAPETILVEPEKASLEPTAAPVQPKKDNTLLIGGAVLAGLSLVYFATKKKK